MFSSCSSLISLDLSYFDTSHVKKMDFMFYECSNQLKLCINNHSQDNGLKNSLISTHYNYADNNNCSDICFF